MVGYHLKEHVIENNHKRKWLKKKCTFLKSNTMEILDVIL